MAKKAEAKKKAAKKAKAPAETLPAAPKAKTPEKVTFSAGRVRGEDGKLTFPSKKRKQ